MNDLEKRIKEWIHKGGYPLEMKVANSFLDAGFEVAQSIYYRDNESSKFREADIIAYTGKQINGLWFNLTFVIECKSSLDKPWVVLSNERVINVLDELLPTYITTNGTAFLNLISKEKNFKSNLFFKNNRNFGYGVTTSFNSGNEKSYEAIQSVTKACEYFVEQSNQKRITSCSIYFPIIFIEGNLFEAKLNSGDDIDVNLIDGSELLIGRSFHTHGNSRILIYNADSVSNVSKSLKSECDNIFLIYNHYFEGALKK